MTTFERTWSVQTGIDIGSGATNLSLWVKCYQMLALKNALISGTRPAPWTVAGSGGGGSGGMDAVDRWAVVTDTTTTGNWMCLRGPVGTAFVDVWFTLINSGTNQTGRMVVTGSAPTGGDATTPPTFTGMTIDRGSTDFHGIVDAVVRPYKLTIGATTQGGWWATFTDGEHIFPTTQIALLEIVDGKGGDLPCVLMHYAGQYGVCNARQLVSGTLNTFRMYDPGGTALCAPVIPSINDYSLMLNPTPGFNDDQWEAGTSAPDFPVWLWATESGKRAFRGRVVDLFLAPDGVAQNKLEPPGGPYESAVFGAFWYPGVDAAIDGYASTESLREQFVLPAAAASPDVTVPVVMPVSPSPGANITPTTPVVFDVTDEVGLAHVEVRVALNSVYESVYDGSGFLGWYTASSMETISGGKRFTVTRTGGWPSSPTFSVTPVDTSGNKA